MRERPKRSVSVIIPTLNRPEYMMQAAQSVLSQTEPVSEIIVVDDGSTPEVREALKYLSDLDESITVHFLPSRSGVSAARNFGLRQSRGEHVLFLDDDDLLHPEMIEQSLALFRQHPQIDVVTCETVIFRDFGADGSPQTTISPLEALGNNRKSRPFGVVDQSNIEREPFSHILLQGLPINANLIRKRSIGEVLFSEELSGAGEDWFFWLELAYKGRKFKFNKHPLSYVRRHRTNTVTMPSFDMRFTLCLYRVLGSGMTQNRYDRFICHLRLFKRFAMAKRLRCLSHLGNVVLSPDLLAHHLFGFFGPRLLRKYA